MRIVANKTRLETKEMIILEAASLRLPHSACISEAAFLYSPQWGGITVSASPRRPQWGCLNDVTSTRLPHWGCLTVDVKIRLPQMNLSKSPFLLLNNPKIFPMLSYFEEPLTIFKLRLRNPKAQFSCLLQIK